MAAFHPAQVAHPRVAQRRGGTTHLSPSTAPGPRSRPSSPLSSSLLLFRVLVQRSHKVQLPLELLRPLQRKTRSWLLGCLYFNVQPLCHPQGHPKRSGPGRLPPRTGEKEDGRQEKPRQPSWPCWAQAWATRHAGQPKAETPAHVKRGCTSPPWLSPAQHSLQPEPPVSAAGSPGH